MKKRITRKLVATVAVAMLLITGAWAQLGSNLPGDGASFLTNWDSVAVAHVIEGHSIPLAASPDRYFHPNYNPGTQNYTLTAGFSWYWTVTTGTAADVTFSINHNPVGPVISNDNYTLVTVAAARTDASFVINVVEIAPQAWGACSDAGQDITLNVYEEPAVVFDPGLAATYEVCDVALLPATLEAVISGGWQNYWLAWTLQIETQDAANAHLEYYQIDKATPAVAPFLAVNHQVATAPATPDKGAIAAGNYDLVAASALADFDVIGTNTTIYTFTLTSINDQALRFSNFFALDGVETVETNAAFTYNAAAAFDEVVITVHPTPTTGPIYHIDNGWAN